MARTELRTAAEMVGWLGAVQAQDFAGSKWSLGLRLRPATDSAIEQAYDAGEILRTHVLRPTWHYVTPADIRWMQALTAPRVHAGNGSMMRQLGLDGPLMARAAGVMERALRGGNALTREELRDALERDGLHVSGGGRGGQRLAHIVMWAELEALLCSGPRRGKQFTYMLLDERAPQTKPLSRPDALVELARRYFQSHGPATAHDFARWSSLTLADTREALEALRGEFHEEVIAGQAYWFSNDAPPAAEPSPTAYLISIFDEYTIGYKDYSPIATPQQGERMREMGNALQNVILIDGRIAGTWRRVLRARSLVVELNPFAPLGAAERHAIERAAEACAAFFEKKTSEVSETL